MWMYRLDLVFQSMCSVDLPYSSMSRLDLVCAVAVLVSVTVAVAVDVDVSVSVAVGLAVASSSTTFCCKEICRTSVFSCAPRSQPSPTGRAVPA